MRALRFPLTLLATFFLLAGCSKDSDVPEQQLEIEQETNDSARLSAKNLYNDYYETSRFASSDTQWSGDESSCDPGSVPQDVKTKIFKRLSYFRKAVGLHNEVSENPGKSEKAQRAALMMQVNNTLDHFPPNSWKCYSPEGKEGAGNSLLTTAKNAEAIDSYMRDAGADNGPVGHRRWLLWPSLQEIGVGNTNQANAVWVLGNAGTPPTDAPEFIAWPPQGYLPKRLAYPRWSFSIAKADFTKTEISMQIKNGEKVALEVEQLTGIYGDNTIVWRPEVSPTSLTEDTTYIISLKKVGVDGVSKDFEYEVVLFDVEK